MYDKSRDEPASGSGSADSVLAESGLSEIKRVLAHESSEMYRASMQQPSPRGQRKGGVGGGLRGLRLSWSGAERRTWATSSSVRKPSLFWSSSQNKLAKWPSYA